MDERDEDAVSVRWLLFVERGGWDGRVRGYRTSGVMKRLASENSRCVQGMRFLILSAGYDG